MVFVNKDLFFNNKAIHMYCKEYDKLNFSYLFLLDEKSNLIELKDGIYDFQSNEISQVED